MNYVAIDFETANEKRDSACAIGLVKVVKNRIVEREYRLINPLDYFRRFCVDVHGITEEDVEDEPSFDIVWKDVKPLLKGAEFIVAHNAPFDRNVLGDTCEYFDIKPPRLPFKCTLSLARQVWPDMENHRLPTVCDHLDIELNHHNALSDAEACANIIIQLIRAEYKV